MRLAVVNLTGGGFSGGYRKYLRMLLPRLAAAPEVGALLCLSPEGSGVERWAGGIDGVEHAPCRPLGFRHMLRRPDPAMAARLDAFAPDVLFLPVERCIRHRGVPVVNMVRNMEPFAPPMPGDPAAERLRKGLQRRLTAAAVRAADHTVAVSEFVRDHLVRVLRVPEDRVTRIYHGLSAPDPAGFRRPARIPPGWEDGEFLFTCGSIRPARGLDDLVGALERMAAAGRGFRVAIAGETVPGMAGYRAALEARLSARGLGDSVCWAGALEEGEMGWCYRRCSLFVMTSRVEACPNIAMEALSHGALSVSAENPPMPEFFGGCAGYYEAGDPASLADAIGARLALDPAGRAAAAAASIRRSGDFSWDRTARETVRLLERVSTGPRGEEGTHV